VKKLSDLPKNTRNGRIVTKITVVGNSGQGHSKKKEKKIVEIVDFSD
jgi:hypothetical protein